MSEVSPANGRTLTVFGLEEPSDRGLFFRVSDARYQRRPTSVTELSDRFTDFVESMREVVGGMPASVAGLRVDEISFTAEVSAKGSVSLLGTGGEVAGRGGITVTLRRPSDERRQEAKDSM